MSALEPPSKRRYDRIGESTPFDFRSAPMSPGRTKTGWGRSAEMQSSSYGYHVTMAPRNARVAGLLVPYCTTELLRLPNRAVMFLDWTHLCVAKTESLTTISYDRGTNPSRTSKPSSSFRG
jgi:hypothetical protein